jgi:hypothetical protein
MRTQVIFIIIALLKAQIVLGQSNLEFESVLNISNGDTYTVPVGKVVKLTSVNFTVSNYNIPLTGCYTTQSNTGCGGPCNYYHCQYSAAGYIVIGSLVFNSTSAETSGLGGCSSCPPVSSNLSLPNPAINFPIWLNVGKTISVASGSGVLITGIVFNLVP